MAEKTNFNVTQLIKSGVTQSTGIAPEFIKVRKGHHAEHTYQFRGRGYGDPSTRYYIEITPSQTDVWVKKGITALPGYSWPEGNLKRGRWTGQFFLDLSDFQKGWLEKHGLEG